MPKFICPNCGVGLEADSDDVVGAEFTCPKCGETKTGNDFHIHRKAQDGLQPYCKVCMIRINTERQRQKREERDNKPHKHANGDKTFISKGDVPLVSSRKKDRRSLKWGGFRQ